MTIVHAAFQRRKGCFSSSKRYLYKKVKDQKNELDNTRLILEQSVKENVVIKNKLETSRAQEQVKESEIIVLSDDDAEAVKTCQYFITLKQRENDYFTSIKSPHILIVRTVLW